MMTSYVKGSLVNANGLRHGNNVMASLEFNHKKTHIQGIESNIASKISLMIKGNLAFSSARFTPMAPGKFDSNLAVSKVLSPGSQCRFLKDPNVEVEYQSTGQKNIPVGTTFTVSYTFDSNTIQEQHTLNRPIKTGETFTHVFSTKIKKKKVSKDAKSYSIDASINWKADQNSTDDKITRRFANKQTPSKPQNLIGDKICNGSKATLKVSNPKKSASYKWFLRPVNGGQIGKGTKVKTPPIVSDKAFDTFYAKKRDSVSFALKITEIDRQNESVEIVNVDNYSRNFSGWTVVMWEGQLNPPGGFYSMRWNLGQFKANEFKQGRSGIEFNSNIFIYNPTLGNPDPAAVAIVKPNGDVADFAVTSAAQSAIKNMSINVNNTTITYSDVQWSGKSIGGGPQDATANWQRVGKSDNNTNSDWKDNTPSLGSLNPNLVLSSFKSFNCFSKSKPVSVKVNPKPVAGFDFPKKICAKDTTQFIDTTVFKDSSKLSYEWQIANDQLNKANPKYVFPQTQGRYDVKLKVRSNKNCRDSTSKKVSVNTEPHAVTDTLRECSKNSFKLTDQSTIPRGLQLQRDWTLAGQSYSGSSPKVKIDTPGQYQVTLKVTAANGCTDSTAKPANIAPTPEVEFSVGDTCQKAVTPLKNNTQFSGPKNKLRYKWQFGNDSTSTLDTPALVYQKPGKYEVNLKAVTNKGCEDSARNMVQVLPAPFPSFTWENTCKKRKVRFNGSSKFDTVKSNLVYRWSLGDSTAKTAKSLKHSYKDTVQYPVTLSVSDTLSNCRNTVSKKVKVKPQPVPQFSADTVCQGTATNFTYEGDVEAGGYQYDFGDGNQSIRPSPDYTYPKAGNYPVSLKVSFLGQQCSLKTQDSVTVYREPNAKFDFENSAICAKEKLDINNQTAFTGNPDTLKYQWRFGSQDTSSNKTPSFAFSKSGKYTVNLKVSTPKGCKDQFSLKKLVNKLPNADFQLKRINSSTIKAIAENLSYVNYKWSINDSAFFNPSLRKPKVKLDIAVKQFSLSLEVKDRKGCINSKTKVFEPPIGIADTLRTYQNGLKVYPNPFGSVATVKYILEAPANVKVGVFSIRGKRVFTKSYQERPAGSYTMKLNAEDQIPEGKSFMLRLQIGDKVYTRKLIPLR